jgi:hypothetical protein
MNEITYVAVSQEYGSSKYDGAHMTWGPTAWVLVNGRRHFAIHPQYKSVQLHVVMLTDVKDSDGQDMLASLFMSRSGLVSNIETLAQLLPPF